MVDKDGSGTLEIGELKQVLRAMGQFPSPSELAELMERMDGNGNGGQLQHVPPDSRRCRSSMLLSRHRAHSRQARLV